jgi:putative membrane-bound dehydrogenase-like protein
MIRHLRLRVALLVLAGVPTSLLAGPPVPLDDRLTIELVAREPQLVTPTGVACDVRDNAWVIESNTHFPPKGYTRNATDRVWVFSDVDGGGDVGRRDAALGGGGGLIREAASGKAPGTLPSASIKQVLFADGFQQAMSLTLTPGGRVYVTCRNEIVLLEDANHDFKPDGPRKTLVRLDTKGTYPHNGLNGAALSPDGAYLYFCLGLNAGFDYAVVGSDGSKVAGGGEGGSVWRCTPDGGKVERVATGFWNCHDLTFDAFGRLFAVDNDPDDIGPCRLLDIIDGGDYGWKFKNGRKGVHPFTSWDGHLPGTLPMVAPTGEAPSGVLAYESDNWPADYRGQLLVTSWGDHTIQRFELKEKGASFTSTPVDVVRGGEDFRPVGIAQAADGSVYVTDWVDKSYTLHGKGKLWRIRAKDGTNGGAKAGAKDAVATREPKGSAPGSRVDTVAKLSADELVKLLGHPKRELRVAAADALAAAGEAGIAKLTVHFGTTSDSRALLQALWSLAAARPAEAGIMLSGPHNPCANTPDAFGEAVRLAARPALNIRATNRPDPAELLQQDIPGYAARQVLLGLPPDSDFPLPTSIPSKWRDDPVMTAVAATALSRSRQVDDLLKYGPNSDTEWVVVVDALAARRSGKPAAGLLPKLLGHHSAAVRRIALQWVGEDRLTEFAPNVADVLKGADVSRDLLAAYLACREKLEAPPAESGKAVAERSGRQFAAEYLFDEANDLALRKIALDLIDPADPKLPSAKLVALVKPMGVEAVKALAWRDDAASQAALREVAGDANRDAAWRREAVAGLARSAATSAESKKVLLDLLQGGPAELRTDALRSLRGTLTPAEAKRVLTDLEAAVAKPDLGSDADRQDWAEQVLLAVKPTPDALGKSDRQRLAALVKTRPADTAGWQAAAKDGGDADNGRRLFSLATAAKCYVCHQAHDRGGQVGPDLSGVGRAMDRAKIVESILEPSKEVAPLYVSNVIELANGDTISGVGLPEAGAAFVSIADSSGKRVRIKAEDIVSRRTEKVSVMPDSLVENLTVREFQDLVAFLASTK